MTDKFIFPDGTTVRQRLLALQSSGNKEFSAKLNPGVANVLGLRVPDLRKLAAEIVRTDAKTFLLAPDDFYMEERMLHGMVLGKIPVADTESYLNEVSRFVRRINSWSVCDTFTFSGRRKFIDSNAGRVFEWLKAWLESDAEYEVRFGVVMLMEYYINDDYVDRLLELFPTIKHKAYYVSMAVAWAISVVMVKYPDKALEWLRSNPVDSDTMRRVIRKSIESYRISPELKDKLRAMRRQLR